MSRSLNIRFTKAAGQELKEAAEWYEEQRRGLGSMFMITVEAQLGKIVRTPEAFPKVDNDTRRATLARFPYGIFFEIEKDHIVVTAVYHSKRNPGNRPNQ